MHDGMQYGRNQGQGQGHSREVDRQSPTGLIFLLMLTPIRGDTKNLLKDGKTILHCDIFLPGTSVSI